MQLSNPPQHSEYELIHHRWKITECGNQEQLRDVKETLEMLETDHHTKESWETITVILASDVNHIILYYI